MPADLVRPEARHQPNDQAADDRHEQRPIAKMMMGGRDELKTPTLIVKKICEEADESQQEQCHIRARYSDDHGERGDRNDTPGDGEIPEQADLFPAAYTLSDLAQERGELGVRSFFRCRDVHARILTRLERRSGCNAATNLRPAVCSSST